MTEKEKHNGQTAEKSQESTAVRPHHRQQRYSEPDKFYKLRNILNIIFIVTALVGIALYLLTTYRSAAVITMIVGVVIKFVEATLRMIRR